MGTTTLLATDLQRTVLRSGHTLYRRYTPYGGFRPDDGAWLGFSDAHLDHASGCYLLGNGHRAFSPALMRFGSPDRLSPFARGWAKCLRLLPWGPDQPSRSDGAGGRRLSVSHPEHPFQPCGCVHQWSTAAIDVANPPYASSNGILSCQPWWRYDLWHRGKSYITAVIGRLGAHRDKWCQCRCRHYPGHQPNRGARRRLADMGVGDPDRHIAGHIGQRGVGVGPGQVVGALSHHPCADRTQPGRFSKPEVFGSEVKSRACKRHKAIVERGLSQWRAPLAEGGRLLTEPALP